LPILEDPNLIVGVETADDAGVYKLSDEVAIIQTVDFFTPIVDDPYMFGRIAATNALSDVYAMGGTPLTAMNIVCFPIQKLGIEVLREVLRGGLDTLNEAGTALVGGHSVEDTELKYGLSVTGTVHPDRVLTNGGAKEGDVLILTKPLGTGIINTAIKGNVASLEAIKNVTASMTMLNKAAAEAMKEVGVNGCTDITGFGLLGHAGEMARASGVGMVIEAAKVPFFIEAQQYGGIGLVPGGAHRNKEFCREWVDIGKDVSPVMVDILYDPQTSGGLLISVESAKADKLLICLKGKGVESAVAVGDVTSDSKGRIVVA
jgi:selenide,water dikinase